jgi:hypothetical protein
MNRIVYTRQGAAARSVRLPLSLRAMAAIAFSFIFVGGLAAGYVVAVNSQTSDAQLLELRAQIDEQRVTLEAARRDANDQVNALALRLGQMTANVIRLNALGRRLTGMAGIEAEEFDFDRNPASGGFDPEMDNNIVDAQLGDLITDFERLSEELAQREQQLDVLEKVMVNHKLSERVHPRGRPVKSGWLSSYYGSRTDPINGKQAWHGGLDFAGKSGTEIVAAADGVVSWSRDRFGYGNMVEINHGNGYVTRYAHNDKNLVALGDTVTQGQTIALMGATGRATGPHLHFEVLKDGKFVNPLKFVNP